MLLLLLALFFFETRAFWCVFPGAGTKEFDLVVFGATGFTGQLVAAYLSESFDPSFK